MTVMQLACSDDSITQSVPLKQVVMQLSESSLVLDIGESLIKERSSCAGKIRWWMFNELVQLFVASFVTTIKTYEIPISSIYSDLPRQ